MYLRLICLPKDLRKISIYTTKGDVPPNLCVEGCGHSDILGGNWSLVGDTGTAHRANNRCRSGLVLGQEGEQEGEQEVGELEAKPWSRSLQGARSAIQRPR